MARKLSSRLRVEGELIALTPLHVGGRGSEVDTDLPLARNGKGEVYVPGTSLTGCLRAVSERWQGEEVAKGCWGFQEVTELKRDRLTEAGRKPKTPKTPDVDFGHASYIYVEDAVMQIDDSAVEIRDGVGINRKWGAAAERIKFDRAVLPAGTRIPLKLLAELPEANSDQKVAPTRVKAALGHLLLELQSGRVRLGAARTRGLGRVRLDLHAAREEILSTRPGILDALRERASEQKQRAEQARSRAAVQPANDTAMAAAKALVAEWSGAEASVTRLARPWLEIKIHWHPIGPLMAKSGAAGLGIETLPLLSGVGSQLAPVLPGSSVKGALRSHAERIVRTVRDGHKDVELPAGDEDDTRHFLKQIDVPLVKDLFGLAGEADEPDDGHPDTFDAPVRLGLGALGIDDCYAEQTIDPEAWKAVVQLPDKRPDGRPYVTEAERVRAALDGAKLMDWTQAFHVAVDRWTGGAAEGALYDVLEPHGVKWHPLTLTLDLQRLCDDQRLPAIALLLLALRDLAQNRIPLGFAVNRGMGELAVDNVHFCGNGLSDVNAGLAELEHSHLSGDILSSIPAPLLATLDQAWKSWIAKPSKGSTA